MILPRAISEFSQSPCRGCSNLSTPRTTSNDTVAQMKTETSIALRLARIQFYAEDLLAAAE
jgi:hypothetical protein